MDGGSNDADVTKGSKKADATTEEEINFDELCGIAVGRFGLSAVEFYNLAPIEFHYAIKDHGIIETQKIELQVHTVYEAMRLQTYYLLHANPYVKRKPQTVEKYMPFIWDKKEKPQTIKEQEAILRAFAGVHNRNVKEKKK